MDSQDLRHLHVGLNALAWAKEPGGVGRYVRTLLLGLRTLPGAPRLTVIARPEAGAELGIAPGSLRAPPGPFALPPWRLAWEQVGLPRLARRERLDLVHGLMGVVPLAGSVPRVVTIHDATFFTHPELHTPFKVLYFRSLLPWCARRARLVITDSRASREALREHLGLPQERIEVIPLAVDPAFQPAPRERVVEVHRRYGITGRYVIHAGVLEPRKNLPRLVRAFQRLRSRGYPHRLLLAGKTGWKQQELERVLAQAGSAVERLGFVPDSDLAPLLTGAEAFAYVPLAEGFGLPLAEALASGAPAITSDRSSLPEVAGGAALLVDPEDEASIEKGLGRLLDDPVLRADLSRRGLERAAALSPQRLAQDTLRAYRRALG